MLMSKNFKIVEVRLMHLKILFLFRAKTLSTILIYLILLEKLIIA